MTDRPGYIWAKGFISRQQLLQIGVAIKDMPTQSDMRAGRLWIRPGNEADVIRPAALVDSLSGKRYPYGGAVFKWPMVNLSPKMVRYIHETFFDFNWYAEMTVQTFNRASGNWECYWVTARWPDYSAEAEMVAGGYSNFQINFVNGVSAPTGPSLQISGSFGGNFTIGSTGIFEFRVTNLSTSPTFSPVQVDYAYPDEFFHYGYSVSPNTWKVYWSTDGVSYQDLQLYPASPAQIRHLRFIYSGILGSNQSTPAPLVYVNPDVGGEIENIFVLTSTSDSNEAGNELEFLVLVQGSPFPSGFNAGFGLSDRGFSAGFAHPPFGVPRTGFSEGFSNAFGARVE